MFSLLWTLLACQNTAEQSSTTNDLALPDTQPTDDAQPNSSTRAKGRGLIINEIMHNPESVKDYRGEWIELYNDSTIDVDLKGLTITSSKEAGFEITESHILKAQSYFVLAANGFAGQNGGFKPDYVYDYGLFKITEQETIALSQNGQEIDSVSYRASSKKLHAAHSLSRTPYHSEMDNGLSDWCPASTPYGKGKIIDYGTPGKANDPCLTTQDLNEGAIVVTEAMIAPTNVKQWKGEWFEVYNKTDNSINLKGLQVQSDRETGFTVSEDTYILPMGHFVFGVAPAQANGGAPIDWLYKYDTAKMYDGDSITLKTDNAILDTIRWTPEEWSVQEGVAINLSINAYSASHNDEATVWCTATNEYANGSLGTPKQPNMPCATVSEEIVKQIKSADKSTSFIAQKIPQPSPASQPPEKVKAKSKTPPNCFLTNCTESLSLNNDIGLDMMLIPAGSDPLGRYSISNDFFMMSTEVTQGQYAAFMGESWKEKKYGFHGIGPNRPVYHVSWYMAADFANHLTRHHNQLNNATLEECYQCEGSGHTVVCQDLIAPKECSGYRLPTEAEWEYAARSGTSAEIWTGGGPKSGGKIVFESGCDSPATIQDDADNPPLSDYAWYCKDDQNFAVAQKLPNGFGLYDMHGNQWEWIADWDTCPYPASKEDPYCADNREEKGGEEKGGAGKGRKGGDWNDKPFNERLAPRYAKPPGDRYGSIGFRLVRTANKN